MFDKWEFGIDDGDPQLSLRTAESSDTITVDGDAVTITYVTKTDGRFRQAPLSDVAGLLTATEQVRIALVDALTASGWTCCPPGSARAPDGGGDGDRETQAGQQAVFEGTELPEPRWSASSLRDEAMAKAAQYEADWREDKSEFVTAMAKMCARVRELEAERDRLRSEIAHYRRLGQETLASCGCHAQMGDSVDYAIAWLHGRLDDARKDRDAREAELAALEEYISTRHCIDLRTGRGTYQTGTGPECQSYREIVRTMR